MLTLRNHTHCQVAQNADTQTKTCQRVWLLQHTVRQRKIKHENTTMCISNAGEVLSLNEITINKRQCNLIDWSFEIPHYSYTHRYHQLK